MSLRRRLLTIGDGGSMGPWNQKIIIANQTYTNALTVKEWIEGNIPSGATFAVIMINEIDKTRWGDNQMVQFNYFDSASVNWCRYRNGQFSQGITMTKSYDLLVSTGEQYTLFYQ